MQQLESKRCRSRTQGDLMASKCGKSKSEKVVRKNVSIGPNSDISEFKISHYPKSGDRHEGYYRDGKRHGSGTYLWANGDKYSGMWEYGLMHGHGRFTWSNGEIYIGCWKSGCMSGHGKKLQYDGSILEGTFLDSKLHGWASKKFIEGDTFEGVFNHDRREGYGEYLWSDGSQYHGMWSYDNAHGVGHMREETLSADASCDSGLHIHSYEGEYRHNRKDGICSIVLNNGTKISGDFTWKQKNDYKLHQYNKRVQILADLTSESETFDGWGHSECIISSSTRSSDVNRCYSIVYDGEFKEERREGYGTVRYVLLMPSALQMHPEVQAALNRMDETLLDCLLFSGNTAATPIIANEQLGGLDVLLDEFEFEDLDLTGSIEDILSYWGGIYTGSWLLDQPHGIGVIKLLNGQVFTGNFAHGQIERSVL